MFYHFGAYTLDTDARELRHAEMLLKLQPKVFQVLAYLIQYRDRLVTNQELLETLWPNEFVVDVAVARCIAAVRQALGDRPEAPQYIQTWHRQGYRFIATVTEHPERPPEEVSPALPVPCAPTEPPSPLPDISIREVYPLQAEEITNLPASPDAPPLEPPSPVGLPGSENGNWASSSVAPSRTSRP